MQLFPGTPTVIVLVKTPIRGRGGHWRESHYISNNKVHPMHFSIKHSSGCQLPCASQCRRSPASVAPGAGCQRTRATIAGASDNSLPGPQGAFSPGQEAASRQGLFNRIAPVYDEVCGQGHRHMRVTPEPSQSSIGVHGLTGLHELLLLDTRFDC